MRPPDIPSDEAERLAALRSLDILDSLAEERFDRLTRMAKRLFDVPIALVSLIDDKRQWFKSGIGLDVRETPRDISFCGHAILGDDIFVIPDAQLDDRFADNPLVVSPPHIRFYAGCPLRVMDGHKIGTLCVIDRRPRSFGDEDRRLMRDLAAMVETELMALQLATQDELTGLPNRRGFMAVANKIVSLCLRNRIPATLAFFDLNGFKEINDRFGHAEGDRALIRFARALAGTFRASDAVARLGGDEFALLLTGTSEAQAETEIAALEASLAVGANKVDGAALAYAISFSHGLVALEPERHASVEAMLNRADELMYRRKARRKAT